MTQSTQRSFFGQFFIPLCIVFFWLTAMFILTKYHPFAGIIGQAAANEVVLLYPSQPEDAYSLALFALDLDSNIYEANVVAGYVLYDQNDFSGGIPYFQKSALIRSNNCQIQFGLGYGYEVTGEADKAIKQYQIGEQKCPQNIDMLNSFLEAYLRLGYEEGANRISQKLSQPIQTSRPSATEEFVVIAPSFVAPEAPAATKEPTFTSIPPAESTTPTTRLSQGFTTIPPVIDGWIAKDEWKDAILISEFPHGNVYYLNDSNYLYLLVDSKGDTAGGEDMVGFTFDINKNSIDDAGVDIEFYTNIGFRFCYSGQYDKCYLSNSKFNFGFGASPFSDIKHRYWEFAIDLSEINSMPGELVHLGYYVYSQSPGFTDTVRAYDNESVMLVLGAP